MKLNRTEFRDKVYACWLGKNIGGTMGGPYEGRREMLDIQGFSTPDGVVLPNDDLDLQLVWLEAVKRCGIKGVNAGVLGEFWLSYIHPYWCEYGRGKNNMKMGLLPPLSGDAFNPWKNSNGAWIRSEIWACLAPGAPTVASKYAYEDASVDHGQGEGTIAAIFSVTLESAAFVEKDIRKLVETALTAIPADSRVAETVRLVLDCRDKGMDYKEARNTVLDFNRNYGTGWFEAPSNIAYAMIGLLWGEGDFKRSMIYAINCGDDTDCTGGLVGSVLGIIGGTAAIPADWKSHIGDAITTIAIAGGTLYGFPKTCTILTDEVLKYAPSMLLENGSSVEIWDGETQISEEELLHLTDADIHDAVYFPHIPNSFRVDFNYASAIVIHEEEPSIMPCETRKVKVRFINNIPVYGNDQHFLKLRFLPPEGFAVKGPKTVSVSRWGAFDVDFYHDQPFAEIELEITAGESVEPSNRVVIEVLGEGRSTAGYLPIVFLGQ